ncbi:MAG: TatD family nuclease-associated radical SAM protein [Selenomonadaceae bacterium]|nr:TatD family nuclease-associated radical SAM protein [Selenomonadaceae bacterium]
MIVYATHKGGKYLPFDQSLKIDNSSMRNLYVNITNQCNCDCVFCLRQKKQMARESSLWLEKEPSIDEIKTELVKAPWNLIKEVVVCGFGEPTLRMNELISTLKFVKSNYSNIPTRLNTNGLGELANGRNIAADFKDILDTASISLNASTAERYLKLTRAKYGIESYEAMLTFAEHMKPYVPNVVLTIVDHVNSEEEIEKCRQICESRNLNLRVRAYEDN